MIALGTEPFWMLAATFKTLAWTSPEQPTAQPVVASAREIAGGWRYEGKLDGQPLLLEFTTKPCSDGMSDRTYPLTARVTKGTATYRGCARVGLR